MLYRTDDLTKWGLGKGSNLAASEYDGNFWELRTALNDLLANPTQPNQIVSITANGSQLTFTLSDGSTIGPVFIPVRMLHWRNNWTPTTYFETLDIVRVVGVGAYFVLQNHISASVFDPAMLQDGTPVYQEIFAFAPLQNFAFDMGFYYPGVLADLSSDIVYVFQEPVARSLLIPATPETGSEHRAYLATPASSNPQDVPLFVNDISAGMAHFDVGANLGTVTITADIVLAIGDRFAAGIPSTSDGTAGGLSLMIAAQQIAV